MSQIRLGLTRSLTFIGAILFWTWTSAKIAVTLIGASTVGDDFEQLLERIPLWANWLFSTPWWVPALLAAILTGFLLWLTWPKTPAQVAIEKQVDQVPIVSDLEVRNRSKSIIQRALIGGPGGAGEVRVQFDNSFDNVDLYLEYSLYNAYTLGSNGWMRPERLFLVSLGKCSKNQIRGTAFMHVGKLANDVVFFIGNRDALSNLSQAHVLRDSGMWRCRIVASAADAAEEYVYFVIIRNQKSENPYIIAQNIFEHMNAWDGGSKVYGDVFDLYKSGLSVDVTVR